MSRIGTQPVQIPAGVSVAIDGDTVNVKGKLGELSYQLPPQISIEQEDGQLVFKRASNLKRTRGFHGLARTLVANMINGVDKGYTKQLEIVGVGYRAAISGNHVSLSLGFASPKDYYVPDGITVTEEGGTKLTVSGVDKQLVGRVAADIRDYYPAEPYKGTGIRYAGEVIRRKEGKTVA